MVTLFRSIALAVILTAGSVQAQQAALTPADTAKIKAEVIETMTKYVTTFTAQKPKVIADDIFSNPSIAMGPNGVTVNTPEQVNTQYSGNIKRLLEGGWEKSVMDHHNVCVMNANVAFANSRYVRYKKDGSIHSDGASTYMLNKGKDGWRIVMLIGHDINKVMVCND